MKRTLFFFLYLLPILNSSASIKNVPANFSTIQSALNACSSFDTVLVQSGIYYENIIWPGSIMGLTLLGANGSQNTIIDGSNNGRVITIMGQSMNDSLISISGFRIANGEINSGTNAFGAGVYLKLCKVSLSDLEISNNVLSNVANCYGSGIFGDSVNLNITDCSIVGNQIGGISYSYGCGLYLSTCNTNIYRSKISNNRSQSYSINYGGGIYVSQGYISVDACEFKENILQIGSIMGFGAGAFMIKCNSDIRNCLLYK